MLLCNTMNCIYSANFNKKNLFTIYLLRAFARKKGRNNVTVDDLVQVVTPKGRGGFISFSILP